MKKQLLFIAVLLSMISASFTSCYVSHTRRTERREYRRQHPRRQHNDYNHGYNNRRY